MSAVTDTPRFAAAFRATTNMSTRSNLKMTMSTLFLALLIAATSGLMPSSRLNQQFHRRVLSRRPPYVTPPRGG